MVAVRLRCIKGKIKKTAVHEQTKLLQCIHTLAMGPAPSHRGGIIHIIKLSQRNLITLSCYIILAFIERKLLICTNC